MPLHSYPCKCGYENEILVGSNPPEVYACEHCGVINHRAFPIIAKPEEIHHMGKRDQATGLMYTSNRERSKYYKSKGFIHSSDLGNSNQFLDDILDNVQKEAEGQMRIDSLLEENRKKYGSEQSALQATLSDKKVMETPSLKAFNDKQNKKKLSK